MGELGKVSTWISTGCSSVEGDQFGSDPPFYASFEHLSPQVDTCRQSHSYKLRGFRFEHGGVLELPSRVDGLEFKLSCLQDIRSRLGLIGLRFT